MVSISWDSPMRAGAPVHPLSEVPGSRGFKPQSWVDYQELGPSWRRPVNGVLPAKGVSCSGASPLSGSLSLFLLSSCHEASSFASPVTMFCFSSGLWQWKQATMDWDLRNHEPKQIFLLISCLPEAFGHSNKELTNTDDTSYDLLTNVTAKLM